MLTAPNQHRLFCDLRREPGNTAHFPLSGAFPHIHSKTACRGALVAGGALLRTGLSCRFGRCWALPTGEQHPRRQPRQVLLPLPQNRRKHWVFAGFLFACVAWLCGSRWFRHQVFSSGLTRSQPFPSPPAPKTHPVSPFLAQTGCISLFLSSFDLQNFWHLFCSLC